MTEKRWLYFALGVTTVISIGAVTNQLVPLAPATGLELSDTGITFPDGTVQTTAAFDDASAARNHVQLNCQVYLPEGVKSTSELCATVPPGKVLVVESVSGTATLPLGQWINVNLSENDSRVQQLVTRFHHTDVDVDQHTFARMIRLYLDEGADLKVSAQRASTAGSGGAKAYISGYYVDKLP